ncbi:MAG: hypothetical protein FJ098_05720 [Deltaproteobacteria bacterium]|nr:hypothetical protein [Deltaproteobacteria bacterium]
MRHDGTPWDDRIVDYLYGELDDDALRRFEARMEEDPALAERVRGLRAVQRLASAELDPVPEVPEAAVTAALEAARARCGEAREEAAGFWRRAASWLLTPQAAAAFTLVVIVGVGVYSIGTGVLDREDADSPSMKHEMAPVGPAPDRRAAEEPPAPTTEELPSASVPPATPVQEPPPPAAAVVAEEPAVPREEETAVRLDASGVRNAEARPPAEVAAPAPLPEGAGQDREASAARTAPTELALEKDAPRPAGPPSGGSDGGSPAGKLQGAGEPASKRKAPGRNRKDVILEQGRAVSTLAAIGGNGDMEVPMASPAEDGEKAALEKGEAAPDPAPVEAPRRGDAPRRSGAILDGIVVPPTAEEEMQATDGDDSVKAADVAALGSENAGDGFLDAPPRDSGVSGAFRSTEPAYLTRPEAAEAPGAPVLTETATPQAAGRDEWGSEAEKKTVKATQEEAKKEDSGGGGEDRCAALARALGEARDREDWEAAEELAGQMLAFGCTAGSGEASLDSQREDFREKAGKAGEAAPAKAAPPAENPSPQH